MKRLLSVAILMISASPQALGQTSSANANSKSSPLARTWKANLAKSQRDPNHQFQSLTLRFEVSSDALSLTYTGVNMVAKSPAQQGCIRTARSTLLPNPPVSL